MVTKHKPTKDEVLTTCTTFQKYFRLQPKWFNSLLPFYLLPRTFGTQSTGIAVGGRDTVPFMASFRAIL